MKDFQGNKKDVGREREREKKGGREMEGVMEWGGKGRKGTRREKGRWKERGNTREQGSRKEIQADSKERQYVLSETLVRRVANQKEVSRPSCRRAGWGCWRTCTLHKSSTCSPASIAPPPIPVLIYWTRECCVRFSLLGQWYVFMFNNRCTYNQVLCRAI